MRNVIALAEVFEKEEKGRNSVSAESMSTNGGEFEDMANGLKPFPSSHLTFWALVEALKNTPALASDLAIAANNKKIEAILVLAMALENQLSFRVWSRSDRDDKKTQLQYRIIGAITAAVLVGVLIGCPVGIGLVILAGFHCQQAIMLTLTLAILACGMVGGYAGYHFSNQRVVNDSNPRCAMQDYSERILNSIPERLAIRMN